MKISYYVNSHILFKEDKLHGKQFNKRGKSWHLFKSLKLYK